MSHPVQLSRPDAALCEERDACAIIAFVDKRGRMTHANVVRTIEALKKMAHRSGDINDEGDGCGIMTDIPRELWSHRLHEAGLSPHLAESSGFFVGHFLLPHRIRERAEEICDKIRHIFALRGLDLLLELRGKTNDAELGPMARAETPLFWQVAGLVKQEVRITTGQLLFKVVQELEAMEPDLHVASLSQDTVVYKVRGGPDLLQRVYPELRDPATRSKICLGHSRYSTNTLPTVERTQPFSILAHNGEINTIERLRGASRNLGIDPVLGGSDSQDLNRCIEGLIHRFGFELIEAFAMLFPAVHSEVEQYPEDLRKVYETYRWLFPPSAQGPAAIVARHGDVCIGSVDALGLRPLWFGESDYNYYLSSEKGVVDLEDTASDPIPLAPGEKMAILSVSGRRAVVFNYRAYQRRLVRLMQGRSALQERVRAYYRDIPEQKGELVRLEDLFDDGLPRMTPTEMTRDNVLAAFGWHKYDVDMRKKTATIGGAVIGSMGYQGPLACLSGEGLPNISEYFKENVAVVTNPAIDREREADHFTTRCILGDRPEMGSRERSGAVGLELRTPLLLGGCLDSQVCGSALSTLAAEFGTQTMDAVLSFFTAQGRDPGRVAILDATFDPRGDLPSRLDDLCDEAHTAINNGAVLLILDDSRSFSDGRVFLDPGLALAVMGNFLEEHRLRRRCSLIVRSAAVRNLHDVMFLIGLGADAINPYLIWRMARLHATESRPAETVIRTTMDVLQKGMEKVMSTMGIHELCGYGRIFSSIGLADDLAALFKCQNFCRSADTGLSMARMAETAHIRLAKATDQVPAPLWSTPPRNAMVGKILRRTATGVVGFREMAQELTALERENPVALRHVLGFVRPAEHAHPLVMREVDISIGNHAMPLFIPAMSFGSQGESSFRAYAEAAKILNIICMNGEGGEIPDMLGKYRHNRGQQIASGRFGVHMAFLNSADFLEIKVGQGAKPGEGGHLPGQKVTAMVAEARHCKPGIPLISPSNHHDIYSIEDLEQIITELKTANPTARISVKIPVTSGVGTIAVGVAKAGADIVAVSGFDGGTGAAREHSKKYVGLPAEIGVAYAHRALVESGLRSNVELWADGGLRSGADALKMIFLGAERVGLGTVALMGVGCISCRRCHLDACPRGISTQLRTREDALARGVKGFSPMDVAAETDNLVRLLACIGEEMRAILADLGVARLRDVVGRTDLLTQISHKEAVALDDILAKPAMDGSCGPAGALRIVRKPLNYLTKLVAHISLSEFDEEQTREVRYTDQYVRSVDRAMGTYLAGAVVRQFGDAGERKARLRLDSSVPGNGLCAFNIPGIEVMVDGGAQDGTAKGSFGGACGVFKGANLLGRRVDGSTGKSFAYGAIGGMLMVQNYADSRACIRMSGADAVFGARITARVRDEEGNLAVRAHLKGFAFEYMTGGRVVVLGDPGPWICSGMTGGVIYQCLYPEFGFEETSLYRRMARGADVTVRPADEKALGDIRELLGRYVTELRSTFQEEEALEVERLMAEAETRFVSIIPVEKKPTKAE
ncbi:glutamate synthase (NADPH/NADH) large chain [Desulfonatronum thiosulfatophilum]|uniref:Glutamate synthase (NADPH/NADH) large chain n=1 Tax=Desulfonatronum thiosulfatophilum TaxID=617002 RepID=A0A1G6CGK0_9BACT|nr:glutamate synthase-related protein [Desulfonatronum thiosulfatophilum]SDB32037.1 glutamate synthase (NADPH/NADH) large chain [Desulfonatronum thiosulfatophilum]